MIKCNVCKKWWSSKKGFNIHFSRMHKKQEVQEVKVRIDYSQMKSILDRLLKLELDNSYLKSRVKNMTGNNGKRVDDIERIKMDEARPERDENKNQFNNVVKELKVMLKSEEPILQKGFRFSDTEIGLQDIVEYGVEVIESPIMVEV